MGDVGEKTPKPRGNLVALAVAQVAVFVSGLLVQVIIARWLGREAYGTYSFLTGVVYLFLFAAQPHLGSLLARDVSRDNEKAAHSLKLGLSATAVYSLAAAVGVLSYAWLRDGRTDVMIAAGIAAIALSLRSMQMIPESIFQGMQQMRILVPATVVNRAVLLLGTIVFLLAGLNVEGVFLAQALAALIATALLVAYFTRTVAPLGVPVSVTELVSMTRNVGPFAFQRLFGSIYVAADLLIIKEFHGDDEVGLYRAATIIILQLPVVASILSMGVFPRMAKRIGQPKEAGEELSLLLRLLLAVSVPIAVGGMLLTEPIMVFLAGEPYRAAALPLMFMLPMVPLRFVNLVVGMTLTTLDRQPYRAQGIALAAVFNVVTNFIVVPQYGAAGAAATTLATEILLTVHQAVVVRPVVSGVQVLGPLLRAAVTAGAMVPVVLLLADWPVLVPIGAGGVVAVLVGLAVGAWRVGDVAKLRQI